MPPRNQDALWRDLVAEAGEELILHASEAPVPDAERDLLEAGFDVAKERAKAGAVLRALDSKEAPASDDGEPASDDQAWVARVPATPIRTRTASARWVWLVAAALAVATGGGLLYALAHQPQPVELPHELPTMEVPPPTPPAPSEPQAPPIGSK